MLSILLESTRERLLKKSQKQTSSITTCQQEGGLVILTLSGKIDSSSAALLRARVQELAAGGVRKLVLDLPAVVSMDSAGLGEIVAVARRFGDLGGEVCLAALSDRLKLLFEYAKLHLVFKIFQTLAEARQYLER
ncbi:MAG: STAS domain-containing protein [Acidobacteria bacterium]|nr:STAS domain-containing protein [Acidobacteriota bacterium]